MSANIMPGSVSAVVHPLVIINISDHYTRMKCQPASDPSAAVRVMGILLGIQNGRDVEICTSFEIAYAVDPPPQRNAPCLRMRCRHKSVNGNVVLDVEYLQVKKQLCKSTHPPNSRPFAFGRLLFRVDLAHANRHVPSLLGMASYGRRWCQTIRCSLSTTCWDGTPPVQTSCHQTRQSTTRHVPAA